MDELLKLTGLTKDELAQRAVKEIVRRMLYAEHSDEEEWNPTTTTFHDGLQKQVRLAIQREVRRIGKEHVEPRIAELIDATVLQEHSRYGEPKGEPLTFIEYLVTRAEKYFSEPVDDQGRAHDELRDSYDRGRWRRYSTRVVFLIEKHLAYSIKVAMDRVLEDAGKLLEGGIEGGIRAAMGDLRKRLKVTVKT